jgi:hypothetical protein
MLQPGNAEAQLCREVCNANADCGQRCLVDGAQSVWTTCGAAGICRRCDWYDTGESWQIGANQGGIPPVFCTYSVTFMFVQRDSCSGAQRTVCRHWRDGTAFNILPPLKDCCDVWGCWGADGC